MTTYYIEEQFNRANQIIGYTPVKCAKYKKDLPKKFIAIELNDIDYKDYLANPKNYYISGNSLVKIERA